MEIPSKVHRRHIQLYEPWLLKKFLGLNNNPYIKNWIVGIYLEIKEERLDQEGELTLITGKLSLSKNQTIKSTIHQMPSTLEWSTVQLQNFSWRPKLYPTSFQTSTTQDAKGTKHVPQFFRFTHCHWYEYNQLFWNLPWTETREVRPPSVQFLLMSPFQWPYSCLRKPKPASMGFHPLTTNGQAHSKKMFNLKSIQLLTPKLKKHPNWFPIPTCVGRLFPPLAT